MVAWLELKADFPLSGEIADIHIIALPSEYRQKGDTRMRQLLGSAALLSLTSIAFAQERPAISGGINWLFLAKPMAMEPVTSRAVVGDLMFVQPLVAAEQVMLKSGYTGILSLMLDKSAIPLDGRRFARTSGGVSGTTFCDIDGTKGPSQRLCLIDLNDDGRFDWQGRAFALGNGKPYAQMLLAANVQPAEFDYKAAPGADVLVHAGLVLQKRGSKYSIRFAVQDKGNTKVLDMVEPNQNILARRRADTSHLTVDPQLLPVTIELYGARVEILSIVGAAATYRVLAPFDPTAPILLARAGSLPLVR